MGISSYFSLSLHRSNLLGIFSHLSDFVRAVGYWLEDMGGEATAVGDCGSRRGLPSHVWMVRVALLMVSQPEWRRWLLG